MVVGSVPDASGTQIVLSMTRMNAVRAIDKDNLTITVEAGCVLQNVQEAVGKRLVELADEVKQTSPFHTKEGANRKKKKAKTARLERSAPVTMPKRTRRAVTSCVRRRRRPRVEVRTPRVARARIPRRWRHRGCGH